MTKNYLIDEQEILAAIDRCAQKSVLWVDTEVADYRSKPRLSLIQVLDDPGDSVGDRVMMLDVLDRSPLVDLFIQKIMVNEHIEKVFHNASYDRRFLGGKQTKNTTCTLEIAKAIPYYLLPVENHQLKTLVNHLLPNVKPMDKTEQGGDWGIRPLSDRQLEYAKLDPVYLCQIHQELLKINTLVNPVLDMDKLNTINDRLTAIEEEHKLLDSEVKHLKDLLINGMQQHNINQLNNRELCSRKTTKIKTTLMDIVRLIHGKNLEIDADFVCTKKIQEELGDLINELDLQINTSISWQLKESKDTNVQRE
jgi:ribonuclease D